MITSNDRSVGSGGGRRVLAILLVSVPVALLVIRATVWVRSGIDLPVSDDWGPYIERQAGSLNPDWLLRVSNQTLYPVGKTLDAVAHHLIGGNTVVYQLLTMVLVLGGLLAMQWRLLRWAFHDTLHTAIVFSLCGLMLLSRAYWGGPNLGYHQVLPLVAIMAALVIALRPVAPSRWAVAAGLGLGLFGGLSYISGAFAALAAGATMVGIGFIARFASRHRIRQVGVGLLTAGVATASVQVIATRLVQGDSSGDSSLTLPWDPYFWPFLAGKIGASLGLDPWARPKLALTLTLMAVAITIAAILWAMKSLRSRPPEPTRADVVSATTLTLSMTILAYLMIISAARAHAWPLEGTPGPIEIFQTGFHRFHFYWVTALWPWVGAVALSLLLGWTIRKSLRIRRSAVALAAVAYSLVIASAVRSGAYDYDWFFRVWAESRLETYRCLLKNMQEDDGQGCYGLPADLRGLVSYAASIDASWTRTLYTLPMTTADLLFSLRDPSTGSIRVVNAVATKSDMELSIKATDDAQLLVRVADAEGMERCRSLEIHAELHPEHADEAQVFYRRPGDDTFTTDRMASAAVEPDGPNWITTVHLLTSEDGFSDVLRYDPVFTAQDVEVTDLLVYCRFAIS